MTYRVIYKDDSLEHGGLWDSAKKGLERAGHKYLKREWKNGRWHYVYKTSDERTLEEQRKLKFDSKMQDNYYGKTGQTFMQAYKRNVNAQKREKLAKKRKKPKNVKNAVNKGKEKVKKFFQKNWGKVNTSGADKVGGNIYATHDVKLKRN